MIKKEKLEQSLIEHQDEKPKIQVELKQQQENQDPINGQEDH